MATISLEGVTKTFPEGDAIRDVTLDVADGELMVLLGPSGSGKSTVLRVIAGLENPTEGIVLIGDEPVGHLPAASRNLAMVFQDVTLYPFMTARRNVEFPLQMHDIERDEIDRRVEAESRVLAIEQILEKMPKQLSSGHQQLVQAARAMVRVPQAFLMDEPLARMDAHLRELMRREIRLLQRGYGVTMIYVTNDQTEGLALADRIAVLSGGSIQQVATPMVLYREPVNEFVATFVGIPQMNIVAAMVRRESEGYWLEIGGVRLRAWASALGSRVGRDVHVGVRPESVQIDRDGVDGRVEAVEELGSHAFVWVDTEHGQIVLRTEGERPERGKAVKLRFTAFHVFDAVTGEALAHPS